MLEDGENSGVYMLCDHVRRDISPKWNDIRSKFGYTMFCERHIIEKNIKIT